MPTKVYREGGEEPVLPGVYQHFKGERYRVLFEAQDASTGKMAVVYFSMTNGAIYTQPTSRWRDYVETTEKGIVARFTPL